MKYLIAKTDKQLGIALRMLYAEDNEFEVKVHMNDKHKIEFHIGVDIDDAEFDKLQDRFARMIS